MAVPSGKHQFAALDSSPYVDAIPVDVSATDQDFTLATGITAGKCARAIRCNGNAGNVAFYAVGAYGATPAIRVIAIAAGETFTIGVAQINHTSTTATGLFAML